MKKKAARLLKLLRELHPDAKIELIYENPLQLLIATILSAQCTDTRVNLVTKPLFDRLKTADEFSKLTQSELEIAIHSVGFYRNKAANILKAVERIRTEFHGEVPQSIEELVSLPGVGRKTANVVLGNAFSLPGLPVDTHVMRISQRLGLTESDDPVKIEAELCALFQPKDWCIVSHTFIFHGRRVCKARKPECSLCTAQKECNYFNGQLRAEN